jgi:hypothetical protein
MFYTNTRSPVKGSHHKPGLTSVPAPPLGDARAFGHAQVTLTNLGREVLAGATDRLAVAPIDCWLGGTHLLGDPDWRWDAGSGRSA